MRWFLVVLVAVASVSCQSPTTDSEQPNVLVIAVDDLRPELGAYGVAHVKSPHIDRLAAGGLRFSDGYCSASTCTPTRSAPLSTNSTAFSCRPSST